MVKINNNKVDIKENWFVMYDRQLLNILLKDYTSGQNILWATDNYCELGSDYESSKQIKPELITGKRGNVIKPRVDRLYFY